MGNIEHILDDASAVLSREEGLSDIKISHIVDRHFSRIYELVGNRKNTDHKYVIKISTTDRSCGNEYKQYQLLQKHNIRSLAPIYHSEEHNYLITNKEELIEFDRYLKNKNDTAHATEMFYKLGVLFKNLDALTGQAEIFDSETAKKYFHPRLEELSFLSSSEKNRILRKFDQTVDSLDGESTRNCLVSDFSLGNIHLAEDGEFVLLDMGDASIGNIYTNIAYIYLNIKFGSLNQYIQNPKTTQAYYSSFLKGYDVQSFDTEMFNLSKIKHLLLMISFVSGYKTASKNIIRVALSLASNNYLAYKYKRELNELLK